MPSISMANVNAHACNCIGPQNGQPLCPCMMRGVEIKNGRYVKTIDYGPVSTYINSDDFNYLKGAK